MANYLQGKEIDVARTVNLISALKDDLQRDGLHWTTKKYFCVFAQFVGVFLGYLIKSEESLGFDYSHVSSLNSEE